MPVPALCIPSPPPQLLDAAEVAALLEVDLDTLARWAEADRLIPGDVSEGRRRYHTADVLQLMVDINREQKSVLLPAPRSPGSAGPQHDHQVAVAEAAFEANRTLAAVETARLLVEEAAARSLEDRLTAGHEAAKTVADAVARVRQAAEAAEAAEAADQTLTRSAGPETTLLAVRIRAKVEATAASLAQETATLASLVAEEVAATAERVALTRVALDHTIAAEVAATAAAVALRAVATAHVVADEVSARLALDETKTQLFASIIHELCSPMTSIAAYTELLQDDAATVKQHERFDAIGRNVRRVIMLVDDLLTLSSLEQAAEEDHTDVDMRTVMTAAQSAWQSLGNDRVDVSFVVPASAVTVRGDARSLESLVSNLVSNAVKFTDDGGWVRCSLDQGNGWAHLEVSDNGIGIPEAEQHLLFTRFFRSSTARDQAIPGTGLGLAIVQSILARHGGKISVDSSHQHGTKVMVDLPLPDED